MEAAVRAAGIRDSEFDPTTNPSRDVELHAADTRLTQNPSRASLPTTHRRSFSTIGRSRPNSAAGGRQTPHSEHGNDTDIGGNAEDDETPWGPQHPCFPHPNPHVPITSPLYESTRIIRIKRDWMVAGDLAPAFSNLYPEILDPLVTEDKFRTLITKMNTTLLKTFDPWRLRNLFDVGMGVVTGWLWDDFGFAGVKRDLLALERWIEGWNRDVGQPEGVEIIPLRRTAYLCLDIQIPDPQIAVDEDGILTSERAPSRTRTPTGGTQSRPGSTQSGRISGGYKRQTALPTREDTEYGAFPVPVPKIPQEYLQKGGGDA
jgi:hypothetical protein